MTTTTRRTLLQVGAAAAAAVPWLGENAVASTTLYSRRRFLRRQGQSFRLVGGGQSWRVTLTRVAGDDACFNLTLTTTTAGPEQGTYTLRRRRFAPTSLFVVPSDATRRTHQAVINRAR